MAKPEKTFRIGLCSASVFVNTTKDKEPRSFRTVSLQRRYKDGDEWKTSTNFGLSDLPSAIAVMQIAMNHIATHEAEANGS